MRREKMPPDVEERVRRNGHIPTTFTATELLDMELPEPKFAVPGILAQGLGILGGKPKTGKSWKVLDLGLAVAYGGRALGSIKVEQGDVLYLALEDTARRLQDRLKKLLADRQVAPERLTLACEWPRMDEGGMEMLHAWCQEHPEARLIVIDTLARMKPRTAGKDLYTEDYRTGEILKKLADEHTVALLGVHHLRKMESEDPLDLLSGTLGLPGAADTGLILRRPRGQNVARLFITGRDIEERELAVEWSPANGRWNVVGDAEEVLISEERQKIRGAISAADGPMSPKEVSEATGLPHGSVKVMLPQMVEAGLLSKAGTGKYIINSVNRTNLVNPVNSVNRGDVERVNGVKGVKGSSGGTSCGVKPLSVEEVGGELRRAGSGPARALANYLASPNDTRLGYVSNAVLMALGRDTAEAEAHTGAVREAAQAPINHPLDCDCEACL